MLEMKKWAPNVKNSALTKGFTIVELLIVIVVIGILAALVLNAFGNVQAKARDTQRQTDVRSLATALEVYYNNNGNYPATISLGSGANQLGGVDAGAILAPNNRTVTGVYSAAAGAAAPTTKANLYCTGSNTPAGIGCTVANTGEFYEYIPNANPASKFVLYYWSETGNNNAGQMMTKASLN
jgi:prepilin-type N-terminal cleavage/methylation domain-containing protein